MKQKSFAIIGAGLSGCTAALYLQSKGHNVTIYEQSDSLGGVAKDLEFNKKIYFNGPNYLSPNSLLIKLLKKEKFFKKIIKTKDISYGSYTDIFGEENITNNFSHPVSSIKFKKKNNAPFKIENLLERIKNYPSEISKRLLVWCKKFENELIELHQDCSHVMGFGRIHFKNCDDEISTLKKKSKIFDNILGIPNYNNKNIKFCIPINGYNFFFKHLKKHLEKKKIKIELFSKVKTKKIGNKFIFTYLKKEIKADYFIWASNPVPLIDVLDIGKLDNPIAKVEILNCDLNENSKKIENCYIQVFSNKSNIFRIYFYNLFNKNKIAIELLYNKKKFDHKKELEFAKKIFNKFSYNLKFKSPINIKRQIRHILFTVNDYKKFMEFEKISVQQKIIGVGWYLIGSNAKMEHIKKEIDKLNL